jgi:hypothetical protein
MLGWKQEGGLCVWRVLLGVLDSEGHAATVTGGGEKNLYGQARVQVDAHDLEINIKSVKSFQLELAVSRIDAPIDQSKLISSVRIVDQVDVEVEMIRKQAGQ